MNSSDSPSHKPDWEKIRSHYESSDEPMRQVAERFSISISTLKKRSAREGWNRDGTSALGNGTEEPEKGTNLIQNGTKPMESVPQSGTKEPENGTNPAQNGTKPVEPVPQNGTKGPENGTNLGQNGTSPTIPGQIGSFDRLTAAKYYHERLGWAVHPLMPPNRGDENERGKKPIFKGWRNHRASEISPDFLTKYFGNGSNHNIGCVVRAPFVHVDLDSKPDSGASVMAWLATQNDLANVPRERTGGGVHLAFICRDIPVEVMKSKKAPTSQINDKVSAELYLDGLNIMLSPSVHKSGHAYTWEVTGKIPEVSWNQLSRWSVSLHLVPGMGPGGGWHFPRQWTSRSMPAA